MSTPSWSTYNNGSATPSSSTDMSWATGDDDKVDVEQQQPPPFSSTTSMSTTTTTTSTTRTTTPSRLAKCCLYSIIIFSLVLLGLFAYSASTQFDDANAIMWFVFYVVHAVLAGFFVLHKLCCGKLLFLQKFIIFMCIALFVWSAVLVGFAANDFAKTNSGGETDGGDWDGKDEKEEKAYEVAGSSLGLFSAIWHLVLVKCFNTSNRKGDMKEEAGLS